MKKIMVVLMILVAFEASADPWLSVDFAFQMGYSPSQTFENRIIDCMDSGNPIYAPYDATFKIDAKAFNLFKIGGSWKTLFANSLNGDFFRFSPGIETFITYAGIEPIKGISFIYEHKCIHTFFPFFPTADLTTDKIGFEIKGHFDF